MPGPLTADDRLEILELYARYSWAMDIGDKEAMRSVFLENAKFTHDGGVFEGPFVAADSMIDIHFNIDVGVQHHAVNHVMEGDSSSCVVVAQSFGMYHSPRGTTEVPFVGYYVDHVVKNEGRWYFRHRFWTDWKGPIASEGRTHLDDLKKKALL